MSKNAFFLEPITPAFRGLGGVAKRLNCDREKSSYYILLNSRFVKPDNSMTILASQLPDFQSLRKLQGRRAIYSEWRHMACHLPKGVFEKKRSLTQRFCFCHQKRAIVDWT